MKIISTIQKREKLNHVYIKDGAGPGGAHHLYEIRSIDLVDTEKCNQVPIFKDLIQFLCGPRKEDGSFHGVVYSDLLEIVRHRLQCFQAGPFNSEYNAKALEHIEIALMYMNRRVEDRIERNVLGTYNK